MYLHLKHSGRIPIVGVMGPGDHAEASNISFAEQIGAEIANQKWILLTGGRNVGVMEAASKGAKEAGGFTIGILPHSDEALVSSYVDIPIFTEMGNARNNINVLTSWVIVICGIGPGTASELALGIKAEKPIILFRPDDATHSFASRLGGELIYHVSEPKEVIDIAKEIFLLT